MSVEAMALVLHHSRAKGSAKLVLLGIANHEGDGGAWPSLATLARYASVDVRNVRTALRKLEQLGELHTVRQGGGMGDLTDYERPNLYRVTLSCPVDCDGTTRHRTRQAQLGIGRPGPSTPVDNRGMPASGGDASIRGGEDASVPRGGDASILLTTHTTTHDNRSRSASSAQGSDVDCGCVEGWLDQPDGPATKCPVHRGQRRGLA